MAKEFFLMLNSFDIFDIHVKEKGGLSFSFPNK